MTRIASHSLAVLLLVLLLPGCSSTWEATKKVGQVMWDPSIPVGVKDDQPSTVQITLLAEADINPNDSGEAAPLEIQVIYLSEDSKLLAADDDQLTSEELEKVLGKNYIDHQDYTLLPGQYKPLPPIKLKAENRYLGVVGHYTDAEKAEWKKIIRIDGVGHNYQVLVHVRANEIDLRKEEE
ncbi:type VI secretion protein [Yersinia entomophaga]|uniref:Type VI secretion protein n=1 Tax=Yersinia entomophaga TaxID=935293 RepID=A0ABN4PSI0_YERET|nr:MULTISPECIES: type VI secretion system lipoprotein TssJ [Yersinia]ANI28407.1 type VI secretion protein [Yersinia entomophaga]OWF85067.1 type VI secretion system-associated lipoprotein [Yersinia entomophaga]